MGTEMKYAKEHEERVRMLGENKKQNEETYTNAINGLISSVARYLSSECNKIEGTNKNIVNLTEQDMDSIRLIQGNCVLNSYLSKELTSCLKDSNNRFEDSALHFVISVMGCRMREFRKVKNVTLEDLSKKMPIKISMIRKYENAQVKQYLPQNYFHIIQEAYGVNLDYLLGLSELVDRDRNGFMQPMILLQEESPISYNSSPEYIQLQLLVNDIFSIKNSDEEIKMILDFLEKIRDGLFEKETTNNR